MAKWQTEPEMRAQLRALTQEIRKLRQQPDSVVNKDGRQKDVRGKVRSTDNLPRRRRPS